MSGNEHERAKANQRLLDELRAQRAEIQQRIDAAQAAVRSAQETIAKSRQLLHRIDRQLEQGDGVGHSRGDET
jgi:chromosome segregation ATPase